MELNYTEFINPFDISFLIVIFVSIFYGVKNGIVKSLLNLIKWLLIFYLIKNCFETLRPVLDPYLTNKTVSDVLIFFTTLIVSYIFLSFINRIIIGIIQPKRSGLLDLSFGAVLGILRGYIIFVLIIFFINNSTSLNALPKFIEDGSFHGIIEYGVNFLEQIPRELDQITNIRKYR